MENKVPKEREKVLKEREKQTKEPKTADEFAIEYLKELRQRNTNAEILWMRVKQDEEAIEYLIQRIDQLAQQLGQLKYRLKGTNSAQPPAINNTDPIRAAEEEIKRRTHSDQKSSVQQQTSQTTTAPFLQDSLPANSDQS